MVGTLWGLLVPSMLVYKIWWPNRNKQLWEGRGEHEKGKNSVWLLKVFQLFLSETVAINKKEQNHPIHEVICSINKALYTALIKRWGQEIFPVYYGCDPLLLSKKKRRKIERKETSSCLIPAYLLYLPGNLKCQWRFCLYMSSCSMSSSWLGFERGIWISRQPICWHTCIYINWLSEMKYSKASYYSFVELVTVMRMNTSLF